MASFIKSRWLWLFVIIVTITMVVYQHAIQVMQAKKQSTLMAVTKGTIIQRVTVAGKIIAKKRTPIASSYNGYIKKIYVKVGQKVKEGDPLVSIVPSLQSKEKVYPIRAPYAGTVVHVQGSEGEYVKESDTENYILEIDDLSRLYVSVDVPEIDIIKIHLNQQATIKATPILDKIYHGIIRDIALAAHQGKQYEQKQNQYPIMIEITDKGQQLRPGMSTIIDIIPRQKKNVLLLPHEYIHKQGLKYYVILADGQQHFINIGLQNDAFVEVTQGVQVGDKVQQVDYLSMTQG